MRKHGRKNVVFVGFMDLEKAYDKVIRNVGGKLLNVIKSIYVTV